MSEKIKRYLYAAASVLDIWPSSNFLNLIEKETIQDAIKGDVYRVSEDMKAVFNHQIETLRNNHGKK